MNKFQQLGRLLHFVWSQRSQTALVWLFCVFGSTSTSLAQTNVAKSTGPSNRFLLIVDFSHGMAKRAEATLRTVHALLGTNMRGQMHSGDSLGVWTFNNELYAGNFPLQKWSVDGRERIAEVVLKFLNDQRYEKSSELEKVSPGLNRVIKSSEFVTVIIISDGVSKMTGTIMDDKINEAYKSWRDAQQKAHQPIVTVLRAKRGELTDFTVTPSPWPVDFPPLPAELIAPIAEKKGPTGPPSTSTPVQHTTVPPLILSGKKPESAKLATNQPPPEQQVPAKVDPSIKAESSNALTEIATAQTAVITTEKPGNDVSHVPAASISKAGVTKSESNPVTDTKPAEFASTAKSATPQLPPADPPKSDPPAHDSAGPAPVSSAVSVPGPSPVAPESTPSVTKASTVVSNQPSKAPVGTDPATMPALSVLQPPAPAPVGTTGSSLLKATIGITALIFVGSAAWLVVALKRRNRNMAQASFITRSLDRK
jgi:hypothetical protein